MESHSGASQAPNASSEQLLSPSHLASEPNATSRRHASNEILPSLSRSPHPYQRTSISLSKLEEPKSFSLDNSKKSGQIGSVDSQEIANDTETQSTPTGVAENNSDWTPQPTPKSSSNSDSGTEADDESTGLLRGLPAPPTRPRKGYRDGRDGKTEADIATPAVTPDILKMSAFPALTPFISIGEKDTSRNPAQKRKKAYRASTKTSDDDERQIRERYLRRKRSEVVRRLAEGALFSSVGFVCCLGPGVFKALRSWHREVIAFMLSVGLIYANYLITLLRQSRLRIPSTFDPAPLFYPILLPGFLALSLITSEPAYLLPNLILGLSSIPRQILRLHFSDGVSHTVLWTISMIPLIVSEFCHKNFPYTPFALKLKSTTDQLNAESLTLLYPLHQSLLPTIDFLATTSLLPTELQLLSTALINLLLFASTPQAQILKALLWVGGFLLFVTCKDVLHWAVALARVPSWRFRRAAPTRKATNSFFQLSFKESPMRRLRRWVACEEQENDYSSDSSIDLPASGKGHRRVLKSISYFTQPLENRFKAVKEPVSSSETLERSVTLNFDKESPIIGLPPRRRNTISAPQLDAKIKRTSSTPSGRPKRVLPLTTRSYLSLTAAEAQTRKWIYALYIYAVVAVIILGPVRIHVEQYALQGAEPFGWALGYLFGNIPQFRFWVVSSNLEWWIRLPPWQDEEAVKLSCQSGWLQRLRLNELGEANSRLALFAYYAGIIIVGLAVVLRLTSVVEVDTRRKVFHGMMVAMLLPTTFVDPAVVALALALTLAIFLLLDLFRASQLPPISKPLTYFLAPYVDGRDHRGPVIVSHIFLLIGCAIPLWLSLAGTPRVSGREDDPWNGWEVVARDISMTSGIICVGMGDAAASLIGRRYGRHKWFWGGGKSIEGSAAFAVAVTVGILMAKAWLEIGGWGYGGMGAKSWLNVLIRAVFAAMGTSMTETLLTGGNDNVIVPVVLWLLVRGLLGSV